MKIEKAEDLVVGTIKGENVPKISIPKTLEEAEESMRKFEYSEADLKGMSGRDGPGITPEIWKQVSSLQKRVERIEKLPILRWFLRKKIDG